MTKEEAESAREREEDRGGQGSLARQPRGIQGEARGSVGTERPTRAV